jgi:hypothetical protein
MALREVPVIIDDHSHVLAPSLGRRRRVPRARNSLASAPRLQIGALNVAFVPPHTNVSDAPAVRSAVSLPSAVPGTFCRKLFRPGVSQFFAQSDVFGTVPSSLTCVTA